TPYELLYNKKPDVAYFKTFGCLAYVFRTDEQRKDKLTPKSEAMTFVGYKSSIKTYLFMTDDNKLVQSVQCKFDEFYFPR
ncbi:hypothetical protein M378DRAFT_52875, partial [Amanita muscaria Koide BX008]